MAEIPTPEGTPMIALAGSESLLVRSPHAPGARPGESTKQTVCDATPCATLSGSAPAIRRPTSTDRYECDITSYAADGALPSISVPTCRIRCYRSPGLLGNAESEGKRLDPRLVIVTRGICFPCCQPTPPLARP